MDLDTVIRSLTGIAHNFQGLLAVRFMLGVAEASLVNYLLIFIYILTSN